MMWEFSKIFSRITCRLPMATNRKKIKIATLKREILNLGYDITKSQNGLIGIEGDLADAFTLWFVPRMWKFCIKNSMNTKEYLVLNLPVMKSIRQMVRILWKVNE